MVHKLGAGHGQDRHRAMQPRQLILRMNGFILLHAVEITPACKNPVVSSLFSKPIRDM